MGNKIQTVEDDYSYCYFQFNPGSREVLKRLCEEEYVNYRVQLDLIDEIKVT